MPHDLSANFPCPEQQVGQGVAHFILGELGNLHDFFLRMGTAADGFADAVCGGEFS